MNVGKDALQASPWTPALFREAIETDVSALNEPEHARSALSVIAILADHLAHLRAAGKVNELREYSAMLHGTLNQHPDLARLRDLPAIQQIGVRLDTLFQDLYAAERVPAPASTRELLNVQRGGAVRQAILRALSDAGHPLTTQEVMGRVPALKTRQHAHQALRALSAGALVNSASTGTSTVHRLTGLGRQTVENLEPAPAPVRQPIAAAPAERRVSLLDRVVAKNHLDPDATGVLPQSDLLPQASGA